MKSLPCKVPVTAPCPEFSPMHIVCVAVESELALTPKAIFLSPTVFNKALVPSPIFSLAVFTSVSSDNNFIFFCINSPKGSVVKLSIYILFISIIFI